MRICGNCGHLNTRPNQLRVKDDSWVCVRCNAYVYSEYSPRANMLAVFKDGSRAYNPIMQYKLDEV